MQIPESTTERVLILVDLQEPFVNERTKYILENILWLIANVKYRLYFNVQFHCREGSIWHRQQNFLCDRPSISEPLLLELDKKLQNLGAIKIDKQSKSAFKGKPNILEILRREKIEEAHIVGLDTEDCVLATAYDAFDSDLPTCVIEECCQSSSSNALHLSGLAILRQQKMTNKTYAPDANCLKE